MKENKKGYIEIISASALFGIIPILVRFGSNLGPYNLSFFRILIATILIYLFVKISKKSITPLKYEKIKMFVFGGIHGFIILGFFLAIQFLTITSAILLLYSSSIWMMIFSWILLKEKINLYSIIALIISFTGIILVISPQSLFIQESLIGTIAGLLAGLGMGLVYTLSKTFKKYDKISLTFWQNLIAIPFLIPLLFLDFPKFTFLDSTIVLSIGILGTMAFILVYIGLGKIKGQIGSILIMLDIIFASILAALIFQEIPNTITIIGGILIIIGTFIITRKNHSK